jgi:succinate dehydrogenase / fumarate reductase cytochrome b subunit
MSKSVLLKSSIAKKYWMALTGLFLCTFLNGHLLGNLQLFAGGEEGKRAFNEYGYFMSHNIFIKVLSYTTYICILFHAIDGFLLAFQNKKARPVNYAYNKPSANSAWASRSMALLGSIILIFICTHMANFWWKAKYSSTPMPLHRVEVSAPGSEQKQSLYLTTTGSFLPTEGLVIKHGTQIYAPEVNLKVGEGYKDLHSLTVAFFGHDKSAEGFPANEFALLAVVLYALAMLTLSFHLWHGFSSAFQSLGVRHPKYTPFIQALGKGFAVIVPMAFASIPIFLYLTK